MLVGSLRGIMGASRDASIVTCAQTMPAGDQNTSNQMRHIKPIVMAIRLLEKHLCCKFLWRGEM